MSSASCAFFYSTKGVPEVIFSKSNPLKPSLRHSEDACSVVLQPSLTTESNNHRMQNMSAPSPLENFSMIILS